MKWRTDLWAAVTHPSDPRILMLRTDDAWRLPHVRRPEQIWHADAGQAVPAMRERLGASPWMLRQIHYLEDHDAKRIESILVMEMPSPDWQPPAHSRWIDRARLARTRLKDERFRTTLEDHLQELETGSVPDLRPPWCRPGWLPEVQQWILTEVQRLGHRPTALEQVKHWSLSAVLRVKTDGPDFYFKVPAPLPLFVNEAVVTRNLAARFPERVPAPLAIEPEKGWMLLSDFGQLFPEDPTHQEKKEFLSHFAALQRVAAPSVDALLNEGCLDRRLHVLADQIDPLLADSEAIAKLTEQEVDELRTLAPRLKQLCWEQADRGIPPTLVHGDLHTGNGAGRGDRLVFFDWTDACIAHPFTDLHSLAWEKDQARRDDLLAGYLQHWNGVDSKARLLEAVACSRVLIPLHHAVSYQHIVANLEPTAKLEVDVTHEYLREVLGAAKEYLHTA